MFILRKIEGGRINVYEPQELPVGDAAITSGQTLVLADGALEACAGSTKPTFIALADAPASTDEVTSYVHVGRVEPNQVYEVATSGTFTVGAKVAINENGDGITSGAGAAEIVYCADGVALVRFS